MSSRPPLGTLPDVCSALETDDPLKPGTVGLRYGAWFDAYLGHLYSDSVSGADVYYLRCKMLHQGEMQHSNHTATIFFSEQMHCVPLVRGDVREVGLMPRKFALELVEGARAWLAARTGDPDVQRRMALLMHEFRGSQLVYGAMIR